MTDHPGNGQTLTEQLAAFVVETRDDEIPEAARAAAGLLLLDSMGTALANRSQPFARAIRQVLASTSPVGPCLVIGAGGTRLGAEAAAEANSAAIHGSDLDATHIASIIHPTAIAVPVALAVGETADATGAETMTALACGMEALVRLGLAAGGRYHLRGYQATAVLGTVVAALMAARLNGGTTDRATEAAGLSTAVAAGLRSFSDDGTWGKRLITGWACRAGIHADALVAAGFRGSRDALEKRWGLFPAFLPDGGFDLDAATAGLGRTWTMTETEPKRYPCSHGLHPFIEAARSVRDRVDPDAVQSVECRVNTEAARWWFEPEAARYRPDAYAARFSIPYTVARALIDGEVTDASFEPEAVVDARVLALAARVRPTVDPELADRAPVGLPGGIVVHFRDGSTIEVAAAPHPADDATFVRERFRATAGEALGAEAAAALEQAIDGAWSAPSIREVVAGAAGA
jgi:2-methylcitrate dehydratase PrpD